MGSRYGGLKQLETFGPGGETLLDYAVFDAIRAGFGKVVFVIRKDIEQQFREVIGNRYVGKIEVAYAFQQLTELPRGFVVPEGREKPWGTGQAVLCARAVVHEPFAVINADDFYGADSYKIVADYLKKVDAGSRDFCVCGFLLKNTLSEHGTVSRGVCDVRAGKLAGVRELKKIERTAQGARNIDAGEECELSLDAVVSMNMWGFTPVLFDILEQEFIKFLTACGGEMKSEFFVPLVINDLVKSNRAVVNALSSSAKWLGVTYKEDKAIVAAGIAAMIAADDYPARLF